MTNRDKESKFLKDKAYQDSLLAQIEEKRQRKQREKFQTDLELEKEMKLLSPMVMGSNPTKSGRRSVFEPSEGGAYDRSGDVKESQVRLREGGRARSPLEANGGGRTYANTRSADEEYSARYEQGARNDGGGRRGNERSDGGRGGHEVHGGAGGGRITDDDVVSRGEYDRLYTMYSQLLTSSEAMQRQLHLQADTIQVCIYMHTYSILCRIHSDICVFHSNCRHRLKAMASLLLLQARFHEERNLCMGLT